jgi:hypothetical protein
MGHATSAKATDMAAAEASHVITANTYVASAKTTHVTATTETTHVTTTTTTKTTHMASAKAAAHVAATTATTSAGLSTRGKQAASEHRACQNHHHSSSHDILH